MSFGNTKMNYNNEDNPLKTVSYWELSHTCSLLLNRKSMAEKPGSSETASRELWVPGSSLRCILFKERENK